MLSLPKKALLALLPFYLTTLVSGQASGTGTTTRYWDCCKPSCAWPGKTTLATGANPVAMCDIHDSPITDYNAKSGCDGGTAFMPSSESPWAVDDTLAYGYAAVNIAGGTEASWCCACYELTFTSGAVAGKKMIVQATNTGGDLGSNQFDISIPGGGVGIFNGCTAEWGAPSSGWGAQYGGISSRSDCDSFPDALKAGCYWRFDWFLGADNPSVSFKQVTCPAALTAKTGCIRAGEVPTGSSEVSSVAAVASSSTTAVVVAAAATTSSAEILFSLTSTDAADAEATTYEPNFEATATTDAADAAVITTVATLDVGAIYAQTSGEPTTTTKSTTTVTATMYVVLKHTTEYVAPVQTTAEPEVEAESTSTEEPLSTVTVYDYSGC